MVPAAFRARAGAAPLKRGESDAGVGESVGAFRARAGAAPLKLISFPACRAREPAFRARAGAAPFEARLSVSQLGGGNK